MSNTDRDYRRPLAREQGYPDMGKLYEAHGWPCPLLLTLFPKKGWSHVCFTLSCLRWSKSTLQYCTARTGMPAHPSGTLCPICIRAGSWVVCRLGKLRREEGGGGGHAALHCISQRAYADLGASETDLPHFRRSYVSRRRMHLHHV